MNKELIELIGVPCAVVIMMHTPPYAWFVSKVNNKKPFSCELCMSFWVSVCYMIGNYGLTEESILKGFICSFIGYLVCLKLIKPM